MKHPGRTRPFRGADGGILPGSVAEIGYRKIGGVDQWVMIRGESLANPPLVLLYGGPGWAETFFFRQCNAALEKSFTVVYWEQRGSGKSYDRRTPRSSMTVEQFLSDLDELVDRVRQRLGRDRIVLLGHSWGSVLGVLYAARHPEKVAAYVGTAQIGDSAAGEAMSYDFALAQAERRRDRRALEDLRAIGRPPYDDAASVFKQRTWVSRFDGQVTPRILWQTGRMFLRGPERSVLDLAGLLRGFRFSMDAMWPEVSRLDLTTLVPALRVPVFAFVGRNDHWVFPQASLAYVSALEAPSKEVVWFDRSGHEPFVDEPEKFNAAMVELVRPAAA